MNDDVISVKITSNGTQKLLEQVVNALENPRPLFREIAGILLLETEKNFASEGRPAWLPLAENTKKSRLRKNKGSTLFQILQDSGIMAASVTPNHGNDFASISTNVPYAPAQHFGATINHPASKRKVALATNKDGSLKRQRGNSNLAVFAKSGKPARYSVADSKPYVVNIPARPFMPFTGDANNAQLQPQAEASILELLQSVLSGK